jgi:hypothetical protein
VARTGGKCFALADTRLDKRVKFVEVSRGEAPGDLAAAVLAWASPSLSGGANSLA